MDELSVMAYVDMGPQFEPHCLESDMHRAYQVSRLYHFLSLKTISFTICHFSSAF